MKSNQQVDDGRNINNLRYADDITLLNTIEIATRDAIAKLAHDSKVSK